MTESWLESKVIKKDLVLGRLIRNKARRLVLEKLLVDRVEGLFGALLAHVKQLWNVLNLIEPPLFSHLEIDVTVTISQKEL